MHLAGEPGSAFRAMDERGELIARLVHPAEPTERLGPVGERVLEGVDVDILPAVVVARQAAQTADGYRPGILDPAALIDLMDRLHHISLLV